MLPVPVAREIAAQVIPMEPALADGGRIVIVLSDRSRERAVERMRADFVANASHELRTPLASLIGFIETLRGPAEDDAAARKRFLGIMAEQSERMRRLIDDLLGLSRIELTEHQPPTGTAAVAAIAQAEAEALEPLFRGRRATLALALEEAMAGPADGEQLAQVIRNLLENAVRHGREGGEVRLAVGRCAGGPRLPNPRLPNRPGVLLSRHRRRPRHPARAHPPADRALLPGGPRPLAQRRRHRPRPCHRQAHRQPPPRPAADRERAGQRGELPRLAACR